MYTIEALKEILLKKNQINTTRTNQDNLYSTCLKLHILMNLAVA